MTFSAEFLPLLLTFGGLAGVMSGLLGLGGNVVNVPLLLWLLRPFYSDHWHLLHAVLINAFFVLIIVGSASWYAHHAQDTIQYRKVPLLASGALLGAAIGFALSEYFGLLASMDLLFGTYLIGAGCLSLKQQLEKSECKPSRQGLFRTGLIGGVAGGFIGFSGNSVVIPILRKYGLDLKQSMATSNLIGLVISGVIVGSLGYLFSFQAFEPALCLVLVVSGLIGSQCGAFIKFRASSLHLNLALVTTYWISGAVLLSRIAH
jgi:uncharacterized membrane protein YfcA